MRFRARPNVSSKLDRRTATRLLDYLEERIATAVDPRALGKALQGNLRGTWRYRVGDYRLICKIEDQRITIVVVEIGHRRDICD